MDESEDREQELHDRRMARERAERERVAALEADAARYRWLRDVSVPPHNFYLSVPDEFKDQRYTPQQVDAAIDAAIASIKGKGA